MTLCKGEAWSSHRDPPMRLRLQAPIYTVDVTVFIALYRGHGPLLQDIQLL
ncbi:hypothetical protein [Pseudomonas oryzihabitans]|uniref:hypothetical protein n=1 Tax=Pseudomonas oryzihabitans TaxID=47885 RepID=UPI002893AC01|nr:hypothetical protein [Pseudomonas oryzihabitans]MDT3718021.1 hypothetical protein [Pseudomonas oryzihabitans]